MGLVEITLFGIATIFMATFARILGEDAKTFIPRISEKLIRRAAKKLSAKYAYRYQEEWLADLNDRPEMTSKMCHALSIYLRGAGRVGKVIGFSQTELFYPKYGKRMFDVAVTGYMLIMLVPIFVIIMIAIRLEDWLTSNKGPIYFAAPSYSIGGKRFRRLKFRTMSHSNEGPVAVTSVGKFLRRTSLDELPGLLNVIKGEMTLVGKRHDYPDVKDEKMSEAGEHSRFPKDKPGLINDRMNDGANLIQHAHIGGTEFSHTLWSDVRAILNAYTRLPYK